MEPKKLLLTTDLSKEALRPFPAVSALAKKLGSSITLLHVVEDLAIAPHGAPLAPPLHAPSLAEELEKAREVLEEQRASLDQGIQVQAEVISATDVSRAIADYAEEHGMDMIAMSTHGRSGFRRMVMGSVAESVLRHSKRPVLVFPRVE
jgi:nucleotide-binding universal stress UspA family protein